jgi:glycyl-tRNA synthetase (class II)
MKVVRHYKKNNISEDEIQNGSGTGTSNELKSPETEQKASVINGQIAELINQRLREKTTYQEKIKNIENKIVQLQKQLADLGEDVDPSVIEESVRTPRFSKMLFESVTNRTDEMYVALKTSFDNVEDLSYTPEDTKLKRFAKTIIGYINRSSFQSEDDKAESFKDYVITMLNNSHISITKKETQSFIDTLTNTLKENVMFSWIFA